MLEKARESLVETADLLEEGVFKDWLDVFKLAGPLLKGFLPLVFFSIDGETI